MLFVAKGEPFAQKDWHLWYNSRHFRKVSEDEFWYGRDNFERHRPVVF